MNIVVKFAAKEGAIIPSKRDEDAGYDIYPFFEEDNLEIKPGETVMIPTGLYSAFSKDYVAILKERGSTGTKGMGQRAGVIDSGYRGEWMIPITNHNNISILISKTYKERGGYIVYPYDKAIAQAIFVPVGNAKIQVMEIEELQKITSLRGAGKTGSTKK